MKPENLVFDKNGYLHLTDFGIARKKRPNNARDTSGTPGYMAPEVMFRKNHSFEVDFFAAGIILYEIVMGKRPYRGANRKEIREMMVAKQAKLKKNRVTGNWSDECLDLCNNLIKRKETQRLGYYGGVEIMGHPWFSEINWDLLREKKLPAPFVPKVRRRVNVDD